MVRITDVGRFRRTACNLKHGLIGCWRRATAAAQIKALQTEAAFLRKTLDSLREERRQARETVSRQFTEIQNLRAAQASARSLFHKAQKQISCNN